MHQKSSAKVTHPIAIMTVNGIPRSDEDLGCEPSLHCTCNYNDRRSREHMANSTTRLMLFMLDFLKKKYWSAYGLTSRISDWRCITCFEGSQHINLLTFFLSFSSLEVHISIMVRPHVESDAHMVKTYLPRHPPTMFLWLRHSTAKRMVEISFDVHGPFIMENNFRRWLTFSTQTDSIFEQIATWNFPISWSLYKLPCVTSRNQHFEHPSANHAYPIWY